MGCLNRLVYQIGCLVLGLAIGIGAFVFRDQLSAIYHKARGTTPPAATAEWSVPHADSRLEATRLLERLTARGGPAFVDLEAHHVASLIEEAIGRAGGRGIDSISVGLKENEVLVRGSLDLSRLPRDLIPSPMRGMLGQREPVILGGPLAADSTNRLFLEVSTLRVSDFPFPRAMIARLLREARVPGVEENRVPLPSIRGIGDVRVSADAVRVYRGATR